MSPAKPVGGLAVPDGKDAMVTSANREELLRKEQFNFALFQHHPSPMTVVDVEGRVVKSNLARRNLSVPLPSLGVTLFDLRGDSGERRLFEELTACIGDGRVRHAGEHSVAGRMLDLTFSPFPDGAIVISHDITDKKRAEAEAQARGEQLIRAQKLASIGTLVSGVAHEVSNPNNVLLLSAKALNRLMNDLFRYFDRLETGQDGWTVGGRPYADVKAEALEQMDVIQRAALRIQGTVTELKDYSRAENRAGTERVRVNELVRGACTLMGSTIRAATGRFSVNLQDRIPDVNGNPRRLEQVIVNLLSNACQALDNPAQAVAVATSFDPSSRLVSITVTDEGRGISEDALARIKDPFFTTKHDSGGTGLGLSVSEKIAAAHGGSLDFKSTLGKGTSASLRLPAWSMPDTPEDPGAGNVS
jgi:signal transduction histidine kinase